MLSRVSVLVLVAALLPGAPVLADTVATGTFLSDGNPILDGLLVADDTPAETFTVPGAGAVDVKFTLGFEDGDFLFTFGFYQTGDIAASILDEQAYMTEVLTDGTVIFDEHGLANTDGDMQTVSIAGGTEIAFFLIPNDSAANFNSASADYFFENEVGYDNSFGDFIGNPAPLPTFSPNHQPMSSETEANYDNTDQMLALGDMSSKLLLIWEDISRSADFASDPVVSGDTFLPPGIDFDDISVRVEAIPEPMTLSLMGVGSLALAIRKRRFNV
jgi:hypothetical protein